MKRFWFLTMIVGGCLVVLELYLRVFLGLTNSVIYVPDAEIGYLPAPSQQTNRMGNRVEVNEYSMRSPPISPAPAPQTLRILILGDSIANGGWWTDQSQTLSALISQQLEKSGQLPPRFNRVEVLNASASSWGPPNHIAYLRKFGDFQSQVLLLVLNTDDLFTKPPSSRLVGRDPSYPDHRPQFAVLELLRRYLLPPSPVPAPPAAPPDLVGFNLAALQEIWKVATANHQKLIVVITPLKREVVEDGPRDYEQLAKQRLEAWSQNVSVPYIDFLPVFQGMGSPSSLYRDSIHLKPTGNQLVTQEIIQRVLTELESLH